MEKGELGVLTALKAALKAFKDPDLHDKVGDLLILAFFYCHTAAPQYQLYVAGACVALKILGWKLPQPVELQVDALTKQMSATLDAPPKSTPPTK